MQILHDSQWGHICDDEWDAAEADVICRQLGYPSGVGRATLNSHFGPTKSIFFYLIRAFYLYFFMLGKYWMDNVYCDGNENEITDCRFDGWGVNDCTSTEAAGVVCQEYEEKSVKREKKQTFL